MLQTIIFKEKGNPLVWLGNTGKIPQFGMCFYIQYQVPVKENISQRKVK